MMPHQRNRGRGNEKPRCRRQDVEPQKERDAPSQDLVLSHHPIHSAPGDFFDPPRARRRNDAKRHQRPQQQTGNGIELMQNIARRKVVGKYPRPEGEGRNNRGKE